MQWHRGYDRTTYDGNTVNWRTKAMLYVVGNRLYGDPWILTVYQGSYNRSVSASGGTHDGGGAVDLSAHQWWRKIHALRRVGFAAWHRPAIPGLWGEHIHAIAIGDRDMSRAAEDQIRAYRHHRNGLASNRWDPYPYHPFHTFDFRGWMRAHHS